MVLGFPGTGQLTHSTVDNPRSMLLVRIRAAKALECAESLPRSDPAEEF